MGITLPVVFLIERPIALGKETYYLFKSEKEKPVSTNLEYKKMCPGEQMAVGGKGLKSCPQRRGESIIGSLYINLPES